MPAFSSCWAAQILKPATTTQQWTVTTAHVHTLPRKIAIAKATSSTLWACVAVHVKQMQTAMESAMTWTFVLVLQKIVAQIITKMVFVT